MRVGQWPMVTAPQRSKCWKRSWSHLSDQPSRSSAHSLSDSLQPPYPEYLQHEKGGGLEQSKVDFTVCTYLCWSPAVYVLLWSQGSNTCKSWSCETWSQHLGLGRVYFQMFSATCPPARLCLGPRSLATEVPNSGMEKNYICAHCTFLIHSSKKSLMDRVTAVAEGTRLFVW